ncbi:bacteriohemerythrin [Methylomarinum vadi]|uniref:bacteriohemerythrin n=1 Tax=Methylomarinum vadi TaxID=438855 RepID=UPI0004DFA174|nr:bacteriohemerythrin [Methylomarinum vadi]
MAIIIWNESYNLGIEEIDQQHRKLVNIINELNDGMEIDGNLRQIITLFDELIDYTHYHFTSEEQYMLLKGYDSQDFKTHQANHIAFLKKIRQEQGQCHSDPEKVSDELLDFLVGWMVNHILGEDKKMARAILHVAPESGVQYGQVDVLNYNLYGALRESESRFKELADSLPAYIWISNEKGRRIYCSKQWRELSGLSCELLSKNWPSIICSEDRQRVVNDYSSNILRQQRLEREYRVHDHNGGVRWLLETVVPRVRKDKQFAGFMGCAIDITRQKTVEQGLEQAVQERTQELQESNKKLAKDKDDLIELNRQLKEAQGQLVQSEKMASIGQLAAGVAHEINNPLGYINSNLHTLQQYLVDLEKVTALAKGMAAQLPENNDEVVAFNQFSKEKELDFLHEDLRDLVKESMEGATRARQIVQDLRNFSRVNSQKREMFDIEKGLDATLNIVYNELKYKARIHKDYSGLPLFECVGSQLNQVFMNLLVNAAHAIEDFGDITIRTGRKDDDWIWVEVEDTGKGIPEDIRGKIFDPFFTTKPVGEGTGLGLSLTYKIIQDHRGEIELDSKVGQGTRFRVYFPLDSREESICIT